MSNTIKDELKIKVDALKLSVHKHKDGNDFVGILDNAMSIIDTVMDLQDSFTEEESKKLITSDMFTKN